MKGKSLSKAIKITLIVLLIILIVLAFFIGKSKNEVTRKNTPIYSTIESMPDIATLINQVYGKYIKTEDSKNEKYYKDIYVKLKYNLFEDGVAKKDFYNALISNVAQMMDYQNVRVIDEAKEIELKIVCDSENKVLLGAYINNDVNFYGHYESQLALANYKPTEITNFNINSEEINTLLQNSWNKKSLNIGNAENKIGKYVEYSKFGIEIYEIDEKVFNMIFDFRYNGDVVAGIKVGENLENIVKILGTPTYGNLADGYIGYKGNQIYVFFNKDQISVYPVDSEKTNLSNIIKKYEEDSSIKKLVTSATDIWENYEEYNYNEYTVNLTYPLVGVKFQFGIDEDNGIKIYNNYIGKVFNNYTQEELQKLEIEIPSYIYFVNEDSVNDYEKERYNLLRANGEDSDFEDDNDDWKYL